ncbi:hypothetical protein Tco_0760621 [Tanacetum coccineum]
MEDGIYFNQSKYIKEMLKMFGLEDSKPTKMPMSTEIKLTKDGEANSVDSPKYRGICLYYDVWSLDQLERTLKQIPQYNSTLTSLEDIRKRIHRREYVYVAEGNRDHAQASIALMLYRLETRRPYNLAYFIVMRMNYFRDRVDKVLPYGMILTRLFKNLKATIEDHHFDDRYILVPRRMPSPKAN